MNPTADNEERRLALRMALHIPVIISGRTADGAAWGEPTQTNDISTSGALFRLNQRVEVGERLHLRAHKPDGAPVEVAATVIRTAPATFDTTRVGVSVGEPAEDWLRLFVSWVASEQPASGSDPLSE
jgi:hypothetical protein